MDCADIVIGQARGNLFRVFDYYSRDRATPRRDYFYGGDDDITAAVGKEVNGVTSIIFRRPLSTGDSSADHDISDSLMRVIWSFGQVYPDYFHSPNSGIEAETVSNTRFYQPDEIKYHGTRNRGATSINFFGELTLPHYEKIPGNLLYTPSHILPSPVTETSTHTIDECTICLLASEWKSVEFQQLLRALA